MFLHWLHFWIKFFSLSMWFVLFNPSKKAVVGIIGNINEIPVGIELKNNIFFCLYSECRPSMGQVAGALGGAFVGDRFDKKDSQNGKNGKKKK